MKINEHNENRKVNIFIQGCGLLAVFLGVSAILGWLFDIAQLASFDSTKIPMALSTAVLFTVYGLIIFLYNRFPSSRMVARVGITFSSVAILVSLLLLYLSLSGIRLNAEHLGMNMSSGINTFIVGHMSPITAIVFVFLGLSSLLRLMKTRVKIQMQTAFLSAVLVIAITIILLLSYLFGTPLLYKGGFIPPALTTSLAFLFLGIALLLNSGLEIWLLEEITGAINTRSTYTLYLIFIALIVGIITSGYLYYRIYEKNYRTEIEHQLSSIALLKVDQIIQWRLERLGDAEVFYKNTEFSGLVKRYINNPNDTDAKNRILKWIGEVQSSYKYNRICIYTKNGDEVISTSNEKILKPYIFTARSSEVLNSGEIFFEDFYRDENDNRIYLTIFIPILSEKSSKNVIGILALRIDPEQYLYPLINAWPTLSKTAETLLVRREGNEVVFLNELKFEKNTALNLRRPLTDLKLPGARAALGNNEIMEGIDYRGVPVIAYVCPIPTSPWFIVARMDLSEVYAPLRERMWFMIILLVGLLIGSGTSVGQIWHHQRVKFYKEKSETTAALIASETRYRRLFEAARDGILILDAETGMIVDVNPFLIQLLGFSKEQFLEKTIWEIGSLKDIVANQDNFLELQQKEFVRYEDIPLETFDGQDINVEFVSNVYVVNNKKVIQCNIRDITERKRAEEVLRKAEKTFRFLFENNPLCMWVYDLQTLSFLAVNDAAVNKYGYTREEFLSMTLKDIRPPEDISLLLDDVVKERTTLQHSEGWRHKLKDGRIIIVEIASHTIDFEGHEAVLVVALDITERKQAEENLRKHSVRLNNLHRIDQAILLALDSPEEVVQTAIQHIRGLLQCQRVSVGIFDLEKKEVRVFAADIDGKTIVQVGKVLTEEVYGIIDTLRQSRMEIVEDMSGVTSPSVINRILQAEGVQSSINIALVSALEMYGVLNIGWDNPRNITLEETEIAGEVANQITIAIEKAGLLKETKRYAAELELRVAQRTSQLEEANKELESFSYSVSHDLRAPLRHISGFVSLLTHRFDESLPAKAKHYLESIADSTHQMGTLIDDLLQFSRTSHQEMLLIDLDMEEVLQEALAQIKHDIKSQNIEWVTAPLPNVHGDKTLLRLVWINLLSNAVKFTRKKEKACIEIKSYIDGDEIVFSVKDNGVGFDMMYAQKLFGVFQRLHSTEKFEGTGIGLANVRRIILKHGGRTWAEAEPDKGATFYFTLPKIKEIKSCSN
ncbi:MAG: PAS domain S-box protein [Ignavibacteria bacterium]|nr:PAS domain S-box protein [Ignavibacteria bacterium]